MRHIQVHFAWVGAKLRTLGIDYVDVSAAQCLRSGDREVVGRVLRANFVSRAGVNAVLTTVRTIVALTQLCGPIAVDYSGGPTPGSKWASACAMPLLRKNQSVLA